MLVCLVVCLFICLLVCLFACGIVCLLVCVFVCLVVRLIVWLCIWLFVCLFVCVVVGLFACLKYGSFSFVSLSKTDPLNNNQQQSQNKENKGSINKIILLTRQMRNNHMCMRVFGYVVACLSDCLFVWLLVC